MQRHQALNTIVVHHTRMTAILTQLTACTSKVVTDATVVPPVTAAAVVVRAMQKHNQLDLHT
eukprot:9095-Heterococcus_DN1.PRE.3